MASTTADQALPNLRVVDLSTVRVRELRPLWEREVALWRDVLDWDVSSAMAALERAARRGGILGKAVRLGDIVTAYGYHVVEGERGLISGLVVSPAASGPATVVALLKSMLVELERHGVRRIETQFVSFDAPWLSTCFTDFGFTTHWREFLQAPVDAAHSPLQPTLEEGANAFHKQSWSGWNIVEMASLMERAHRGGADAKMNELYQSSEGCQVLLNNILRQRGCGATLTEASAIVRERDSGRTAGFIVVTEIADGHAHVAQVAVEPDFQGRGIGGELLDHAFHHTHKLGLRKLSLMVSRDNARAVELYRKRGFDAVHQFPVFSREL